MTGRTKTEVREKLKKLQAEADAGLKTSVSYTVAKAVNDWAAEALDGLADKTVRSRVDLVRPVTMLIGNIPLRDLTAHDVRRTLNKLAETRSTRTMASTHNVLVRAIRHAEANDHVGRNVASFVKPPQGKTGRPSRAMTAAEAAALLAAAKDHPVSAPWSSPPPSDLRITRVFSCVARGFKPCASFMSAGCCWWRSLAVDGGSGTSRGHMPVMRRPGSRSSGTVSRPSVFQAGHISWTLQEPQTERREHQDDPDVYYQPLPELVPEEQDIHTDHDSYQREHVKHDGCLPSHRSCLLCATEWSKSGAGSPDGSRLRLEGRTRTLSGPSPALRQAISLSGLA